MDQRLAEEDSLWDEDVAEEGTGIGDEATPADHDTVSCERGGQRSAIEVFCNELFGVGSAFDFSSPHGAREESIALSRQTGAKNPTLMPGLGGFKSVYPRLRQALVQGWRRAATTGERVESACQDKEDDARSRQADGGQMSDDPQQAVANPVPPTPSEVLTASSVRMMLGMASALRTTNPEALHVICSTLFDLLLETPPLVLAPLRQSPSSLEATTFRKVGEFCVELLGSANHAEHQPALRLHLALAVSKGEVSGLLEVVNCFLDRARLDAKDGGTPALLHFPGGAPPSSTVAAVDTAKPERGQCRDRDAGVSAVLERLANQRVNVDPPFPSPRDDGPFGWKEVLRNLVEDSERTLKGSASRYSIPPLRETAVFVLAHLDRLGAHYLGCKGERAQAGGVGSPIPSLQKRGLDVPFCFDLAPETFRHLVDLVERSAGSIEKVVHVEDDDREEKTIAVSEEYLELYVLSASLRLLNVNIGILLGSGLGVEEFGGEGMRRSLLRCLLGLVRHCETHWTRADFSSRAKSMPHTAGQVGRGKAAEEALRLLVDGMDLFYPSKGLQASLLSSYLRAFGTSSDSHTTASHALVLELLCRTSAPEFLRSFLPERRHPTPPSGTSAHGELLLGPGLESCEESPRSPETLDSFAEVLLESSSAQAVKEVRNAAGMVSVGCDSAPGAESVLMSDKLRESSEEVGQAVLRALDAVLNLRCVDAFQAAKEGRVEGVESTADIRKFLLLVLQASSNILASTIEARCCATSADMFERVVEAVCNGLVGTLLPSCLASALALPVDATDLLREPLQQHLVRLTRTLRLLTMAGCAPHVSAQRSPSVQLKGEIGTLHADFGVEALEQESPGEGGVGATTEHRSMKEGNKHPEARTIGSSKLSASSRILVRIERLCSALGASLVRRMVMGEPRTAEEEANAQWLVHPLLLHAEVISGRREWLGDQQDISLSVCDTTVTTRPQPRARGEISKVGVLPIKLSQRDGWVGMSLNPSAFVHQLSMNPSSRESLALSRAMRRVVLQDRGGDPATNAVVWSVALAAVYHAGLAGELAEVARAEINWAESNFTAENVADSGAPMNPSPALVWAWRSAQTTRARLTRGTRALVLQRARFLLFLEPWVSMRRVKRQFGSPRDVSFARALKGSELVLECLLSPVETASARDGGGGVDGAEDSCAVHYVDAREADQGCLLHIIDARSERATTRARGFELAAQLLDGTSSDRATADVLRAVADGLLRAGSQRLEHISPEGKSTHQAVDKCATERLNEEHETTRVLLPPGQFAGEDFGQAEPNAGRLHFVRGTKCCDPKCKLALVKSVAGFLGRCSIVLGQERIGDRGSAGNRLTRPFVLVNALRAVSMDYEFHDHDLIQRSQLLPPIASLVDDADRSVAAEASRALQAVYRCAVPAERGMSDATWERVGEGADCTSQRKATRDGCGTPFQVSFFGTVRSMLERTAEAIGTKTPGTLNHKLVEDEKTPTAGTPVLHIERMGGGAGCALSGERMLSGQMEARAAQVLALAHACCRVECGRRELANVVAVRALLRLVLLAKPEMRGWALRVCRVTLPWVAPRLVHDEFRSIVRERRPSFEGSFVECALLLVGQIAGVWTTLEGGASEIDSDPPASPPMADKGCVLDMLLAPAGFRAWRERVPARESFSLSSELVSLLHELAAGADTKGAESAGMRPSDYLPAWQEEVATVVCRCLQRAGPIVASLQRQKMLEETRLWAEAARARGQLGVNREGATSAAVIKERDEAEPTPPSADDVDRLVAALCLLGGQFQGLHPGARVLCRLPPGESSSDVPGGWEDRATVEATVLRLPFSGTKSPGGNSKPVGDLPADETTSADGGSGDGAGSSGVESAEGQRHMASRLCSARLLPRPAGCTRPLDVYEGLTDEGFSRGAEGSTAVARQAHEQRRLERQQRLMQEHRALSLRMQGARFGRVSRPHGQGRINVRGEQPLPIVGQSVLLSRSARGEEGVATTDNPAGSGSVSASASPRRQEPVSACEELVTVGFSRDDRGVAPSPRAFTVPVDSVTLVHKGVPGALVRTLTSYAQEFLPGLKAMLEAETSFRGPTYALLQSASSRACTVESAHPYQPGEDHMWPISVAGAETVELSFDPMSRVARPEDHIALSWRTPSGGSGHRRVCPCSPANHSSGRGGPRPCEGDDGGSQAWPGVGTEPPLLVMAGELTVRFVTDIALDATSAEAGAASGGGDDGTSGARPTATRAWGFRLTAVSPKVPPKTPRPQPPSNARATLCDLRARASLGLASLLEHGEMSARLAPVLPVLVKAALGAASEVAIGGDIPGAGTPQPWLERRLARAYDLLHLQRGPPSRLPEADFVQFPYSVDATPPPQRDTLGESSTVATSADRLVTSPSTDSCSSSTAPEAGYVGGAPPLEQISSTAVGLCSDDPWPRRYVVCIGGVAAFDKPKLANGDGSSSRQLARLRHGATVAVVGQQRDWLKVVYDSKAVFTPTPDDQLPHSTSPADFWVRQRQDDTFLLMPEALAGKELDMETVADCPDLGSKEGGVIVSMLLGDEYDDEEDARFAPLKGEIDRTDVWDAATTRSLGDVGGGKAIADDDDRRYIQGQTCGALWASTVETLCAATATYGVSALLAVAACWQGGAGKPSYLDLFGSARSLWEFLRLTSVIEKGDLQSAAFSTLKQHVGERVASEGERAFGGCLTGHALGALRNLAAQPRIKAVARVFETPHPYQNNMNVEWDVYLPEAKRIKVVFDPRSRTETSCDWVDIILQDPDGAAVPSRLSRGLHHRFHGRGGRENFPGFGGRLPLWLEGNRFVARFQSDPTATDWGVRFTVYGILDCDGRDSSGCNGNGAVVDGLNVSNSSCGPTNGAAQGVAVPAPTGIVTGTTTVAVPALVAKGRAGAREVELCCWVLDLLSREGHAVPEVALRLCDNSALEAFEACLKTFSQQRRLSILRLITGIVARVGPATGAEVMAAGSSAVADSQKSRASAGPSYVDTCRLVQAVLSLSETQRAIEDGCSVASPYLQGLVECTVVLRNFLVDFADWPKSPGPEKDRLRTPPRADHAAERDAQEEERHCDLSPGAETATASPAATRESPKALERKLLGGGGAGAEAVEDVASIWSALRDFSRGTAPGRLLVKDFLPMLTEACSVVVQSAHPFDRLAQRRVVLVPGALGVQVRFDHRTEMRQNDRIVIRDPARRQPVAGGSVVATTLSQHADSGCWSGIGKDAPMVESCNLLRDGGELGFSGLSGGRSDDLPLVSVGDHVVRGPDWAFGDEDCSGRQQQGSSRIGTDPSAQASASSRCSRPRIGVVIALEKWGERDGDGVRVRWATEQVDTAAAAAAAGATRDQGREGFEALYCVQNPAHVRVIERGGEDRARRPIVRAGSSVEIEVVPGASGKGDGTTPPSSGGPSDAHLFRFDGESTHVDLPSYRGMRLEGDFTLEVWAWLDLGCGHDGKTKCVVSRVLHQPYHQGRPAAKVRRSPSGEHARRAPFSLATAAGSKQSGSPPPAHATVGTDESSGDLAWCSPVSPHEVRSRARCATGTSIPGGVVAAGAGAPPRVDGDLSPMEGSRLVGVQEADRHRADEVGREGAGWERVRPEKGLTSASGAVNGFADGGLPEPLLPSGGTRAGDNEGGDEEKTERCACGKKSVFVEGDDGIEESEDDESDGEVRENNDRANSYEADDNGKLSLSFEDAVPSAPQDVVISSITDSSIKMSWSPPTRVGRPALHSYIICLNDVEIASVGAGTLEFTNTNRLPGSPCSYSVAARGAAGTSPCCSPVVAGTTTEDDTRTQLALWVGGRGEIEFSMENERGKGVLLGAGQFREGTWTHMAVSVEGRRVSMFVDGERRASGTFVGHRLFSGSPFFSACDHQHQHQHRRPSAEPLRLGSRGAQDFWRGRLCGMRVWGAASQAVDIRRRISSLPSASLVRPAPPSSFGVEVPGTQKTVCRLRLHAPLPDPSDGEVNLAPPGAPVRDRERKAYYEVVLRSGGCMQIGWALPSSSPSSHILAVGADDKSWAVDGKRSAKWHGKILPAPSPAYAHGVPYGGDWEWAAGNTIGCAVDLDEGVMSFSHNGRNLGEAFNRATTGRGVGRYRVIVPHGVECRLGVDEQSPVVETYPPGTVLQVSRLERLSRGGRLGLRTAEGWVAERDADDPDDFHMERLERDTSDSADYGTGPERCVFVDVLRSASESAAPGGGREGCLRPVTPPHECKDIAIGEGWSEVFATPEGSADGCLVTAAHTQDATPGKGQPPPARSLLTRGVDVGTADVATFFIELFVPPCEPAATDAVDGGRWAWGVVLADFNAYLTTQCRATSTEWDGGGGGGGSSGEETVAPGHKVAVDGDKGRRRSTAGGSLHVVVDGPGGVFHAIPVSSAFRGRWMNLRIVAHRSGESLLVCTPGAEQAHDHQQATDSDATSGMPRDHEDASVSTSTKAGAGHHQRRLRCGFSNPRFFRGDRLGSVSLYSERIRGDGVGGYPFLARHAAILLGSLEHQPPPALQRLRDLERLVLAAHRRRMEEPTARPSFVFARQRLRRIWSGEVSTPVPHSTTAGVTTEVGASAATANGSPPQGRTTTHSTLTVSHPLLSPGRVALGTTVSLSRNGTGTTTPRPTHGNDDVAPAQRQSVTAWEHPGLQTPARFDPVPLPAGLSTRVAAGGRGLWAWAPVPRSKSFLAMGLVFTAEPEPPSLTDVRCARKELVVNAQPHKCKAVTLQRTTEQPGEQHGVEDTGQCCEEIIIVEEMGVCVPKNGSAWGLSPRVVLGDTGTNLGRRQPRWDGLMPSISGTAGQGMVVNIGHLPFRYPMNGYAPVSQVAHADARFVLQVYDDANRMWQDVRPSHGLTDARALPRAPELIGSWSLCARTNATDTADGRYLANDVFVESAAHTPPPSAHNSSGGDGRLVRLPPARAGGTLEAAAPGGPPMPKEEQEVWGLSLTVSSLFPSEFADAHPWLRERFETFAALVWGEQGQALASNAELVRYVNAVASRKGLSKEALLTCDWAALQPPGTDLADWPLLQSMAASRTAATVATASVVSPRPSSGDGGGGVEETKQSDPPGGARQGVVAAMDDNDGRYDEWVVAKAVASGPERMGVRVRKTPVEYGNVLWLLPSGQAARLLPPLPPPPGGRGTSESSTGGAGWRRVRGAGGDTGWLPITSIDATGSPVPSPLERVWVRRFILDWFSPEAAGWPRGEEGDNEGGLQARAGLDVREGAFWLPLRRRASVPAAGGDDGAAVKSPSPISAARLHGNSDALLLSAVDAGGGDDRGTLLVTGKWTVGLVTDMLTVTTRTSGCTRIEVPPVARDGSASSVGGKAEQTADPLPVLVDGLVFGFRAVDGLLVVTRAFPTAAGAGTLQHAQPVEQQALAWLGGLDEGAEVSFSIIDSGQDVVFSCREVSAPRRTATVRAKCRDTWGRGRVALGCHSVKTESSTSGWVRVTSQAHGATVRSGRSIDADGVVGRIPCGTVVPFDSAVLYHSPGAPDRGGIEPVIRYRCLATATTPAGWISERGRYANHPYRICEQILARPQQTPASISHVSVARVQSPASFVGGDTLAGRSSFSRHQPLPPVQKAGNTGSTAGETPGEEDQQRRESEWQQRLGELAVLPTRFHLLQQLNRGVSKVLRYVDLSQGDLPWSVAGLLSRCRHLVFFALRQEAWQAELARTSRPAAAAAAEVAHSSGEATPPSLELRLSRGRAARHAGLGTLRADQRGRQTLFCQAFFSLRNTEESLFRLRPGEVLYGTVFVGEHAHDAGGPYRESFAEYCADLQSGALPLLIKCPNSVNDVGINREKWLPNPAIGKVGPSAALHAEMLGFLGRLMGVAIRSQEPLDLDLPSIVWKQLVRSPITRDDLEAVDFALTQSLKAVRNIHLRGVATDEAFRDLGLGGFEVATADGGRAGLPTPGGSAREVTLDNRLEFADMAEEFKMREYRVPVEAIRRGLASVVPIEHLRLFSWDELELFVCGRKEVDVDLLEACTEYTLCCRQDSHVSAFWDVLRSFSPREKSLFLRFAWGRSRLPLSADQFHQAFRIQAFARTPADAYLPVAHTCFFSLELPRYSSREVLETKLRYAIANCRAMDADDTSVGRTAAGLGWGGDP